MATLRQEGAIYRTLRLPRISSEAAALLREFDLHGLLGPSLMVVGTNALAAYEIEAGSRFASAAGVDSTQDFDLTWVSTESRQTTLSAIGAAPRTLIDVMKQWTRLTRSIPSVLFRYEMRRATRWSC